MLNIGEGVLQFRCQGWLSYFCIYADVGGPHPSRPWPLSVFPTYPIRLPRIRFIFPMDAMHFISGSHLELHWATLCRHYVGLYDKAAMDAPKQPNIICLYRLSITLGLPPDIFLRVVLAGRLCNYYGTFAYPSKCHLSSPMGP